MQKVRSHFFFLFTRTAYKTTISNLSFTVLYAVAYILYLALEEGSPYIQTSFTHFTYLIYQWIVYMYTIQVMLTLLT